MPTTKSEFVDLIASKYTIGEKVELLIKVIRDLLPDGPVLDCIQEETVPEPLVVAGNTSLTDDEMVSNYFASSPTPVTTVFRPIVCSTIAEIFSHIESNQWCVTRLTVHPDTFKSMCINEIASPVSVSSGCDKLRVWGATISVNELVPPDRVYVMDSWCNQYCVGIK